MNAIGAALIGCAIQVTLFGVVAVLVCTAAHRRGIRAGKQAALGSLLIVALLGLMALSPWPSWSGLLPAAKDITSLETESADSRSASTASPAPEDQTSAEEFHAPPGGHAVTAQSSFSTLLTGFLDELRRAPATPEAETAWDWRAVAGAALLVVAVIGLLRIAAGMAAVRTLIRGSRPLAEPRLRQLTDILRAELCYSRNVELRESPRLTTAATVGWRRPVILLPATWHAWTQAQRRAVLAHELAHIRQADFLAQVAAQFGLALHFYHPLVHWLARRLRLEQELAADDMAAPLSGGRRAYLNTLAELALAQPNDRVGWPAQMFLPTRGMFLRRIEMLRDSRDIAAGRGSTAARWGAGGLLVLAGLTAVGLRLPNLGETTAAGAAESFNQAGADHTVDRRNADAEATNRFDLTYVPPTAIYVTSFRLAELSRDRRWNPLATLLNELLDENSSGRWSEQLKADQIEEASVIVYRTGTRDNVGIRTMLRVVPTIDLVKEHARLMPDYEETDLSGRIHLGSFAVDPLDEHDQPPGSGRLGFILTGKHTMIIDHVEQFKSLLAADADVKPVHTSADGQILLIGRPKHFKRVIDVEAARSRRDSPMMAFSPLWEETDYTQLVISLGDRASMEATAQCKSPTSAEKVENTAQALLTLAKNLLDEIPLKEDLGDPERRVVQLLFNAGAEALEKARIDRQGTKVTLTSTITNDKIGEVLAPTLRSARDAARRAQSINNLRQIVLAMHNYLEANGTFPPAVLYSPDGKTPYSWKVALLPYLGQKELYDAYRFDEPWDGPNNRKLLARIPSVYRHPKDGAGSTSAAYFVMTGPDTAFSGKVGISPRHFLDGVYNTLMVVESKRLVTGDTIDGDAKVKGRLETPWTRPDMGIEYNAETPVAKLGLGGFFDGGFCAALCDGSVRFFPNTIDRALLRALITKAGGEEKTSERLRSLR